MRILIVTAGSRGDVVAHAVERTGVRAVVQSGWADLGSAGDDVLVVGDVPHDWLFSRTAAVVHHAGAGATAEGLPAEAARLAQRIGAEDGSGAVVSLVTQLGRTG